MSLLRQTLAEYLRVRRNLGAKLHENEAMLSDFVSFADWTRLAPDALQAWRERLAVLAADERGEIIN